MKRIDPNYPVVNVYVFSLFNVMTSCVKLNITLYFNMQSLLRNRHMTCFNTEYGTPLHRIFRIIYDQVAKDLSTLNFVVWHIAISYCCENKFNLIKSCSNTLIEIRCSSTWPSSEPTNIEMFFFFFFRYVCWSEFGIN